MMLRQAVVDRPLADYAAGHFERAAKGFALKAQAGDENVAYFYLWQFLSETHLNYGDALAALRANAAKVDHAKWPSPIFDLFLDASKPEDVAAKAADGDQRCEASFYQGEWYRLRSDNQDAVSRFQDALSSCPKTFLEFDGATAELAYLKGK
jgi:rhomboid protease GluP